MKRIAIIAIVLVVIAGTVSAYAEGTKKNNTQTIYDSIASWSWSGKKASN